jgi:hypothetical protein
VRPAYWEAVRGHRSAVYKPGVGWVGNARRRPGAVTRSIIVLTVIAVCVLLWLVMSGALRP